MINKFSYECKFLIYRLVLNSLIVNTVYLLGPHQFNYVNTN